MKSPGTNSSFGGEQTPAEETLRVIASLPAPEGLAERVHVRLRTAPRTATVLRWPVGLAPNGWMFSNVLRGAAAAAIVCVVAGGGWQIYSRVQPAPTARVKVLPMMTGGGFSSAGAVRKPETLSGPVLTHAIVPAPAPAVSPQKAAKPNKKPTKTGKATAQPSQ